MGRNRSRKVPENEILGDLTQIGTQNDCSRDKDVQPLIIDDIAPPDLTQVEYMSETLTFA